MPRITDFCSCIYMYWGASLVLLDFVTVTLELLPQMILLSGSLVLPFASTQHILHSSVLGTCFVCRLLYGEIMCIWGSCVYQKGVICFLIHKLMSGRIQVIVLSVSMLRFQYNLQFPFSSTQAGVYSQYGLLSSISSAASVSF